jgi:hypothetical protein
MPCASSGLPSYSLTASCALSVSSVFGIDHFVADFYFFLLMNASLRLAVSSRPQQPGAQETTFVFMAPKLSPADGAAAPMA